VFFARGGKEVAERSQEVEKKNIWMADGGVF
jgi:hypothetical protein